MGMQKNGVPEGLGDVQVAAVGGEGEAVGEVYGLAVPRPSRAVGVEAEDAGAGLLAGVAVRDVEAAV
jgi:hypothetical protein